MGRHTGPDGGEIPEVIIPSTLNAFSDPQNVSNLRNLAVQFDSNGAGAVTGTVQLQGSIGGVEYFDIGSAVSVWTSPTYINIETTKGYVTHLRTKTTVAVTVGTPKCRIGGFYD